MAARARTASEGNGSSLLVASERVVKLFDTLSNVEKALLRALVRGRALNGSGWSENKPSWCRTLGSIRYEV